MTPPQGPVASVLVQFITKPADEDYEPDSDNINVLEDAPETLGGQVLQVRYSNDNPLKEHQIILDVRVPEIEESVPPFVLRLNEHSFFLEGIHNSTIVFLAEPFLVGDGDRRAFFSITLGTYENLDLIPAEEKALRKRILEVVPQRVAQHYGLISKE